VPNPEVGQCRLTALREAECAVLVGHDPLDADAMVSKETVRGLRELDRRGGRLVGQDAHEGHAGGVIHGDLDAVIATATMAASHRRFPPDAVTAARRNHAELLDVDVHQLPRLLSEASLLDGP